MFITALIGLMTGQQMSFADKYSQLAVAIRESSEMDSTSEDDELDYQGKEAMNFIGSMIYSNQVVDKRLIELFKLRQKDHVTTHES